MTPAKKKAVAFDLDALEREGDVGPFEITHGGERIVMADALEIDWRTLMGAMSDPVAFFRLIVPADDQDSFFGRPMPTWKLRALMEAYQDHYGLGDPGNSGALPR